MGFIRSVLIGGLILERGGELEVEVSGRSEGTEKERRTEVWGEDGNHINRIPGVNCTLVGPGLERL